MIFEAVYDIIGIFFPAHLIEIPFFEFLINCLMFSFCCWLFSIFFIYPITIIFKWVKSKIGGF